jgi:hypothetical protein
MIRLVDHLEETLRNALQETEGTELELPPTLSLPSQCESLFSRIKQATPFNNPMFTGDERSVLLENIREDVTFPIENNVRHHVVLPEGCPPCRFYFEALAFYLAEDSEGRTRSLRLLGLFTGVIIWT